MLLEVQSQEQATDSRVERLAGRAEGRRAAAEKAKEAVGARPIHITSQLGLVAQRRLRARGWEDGWAAVEARRMERARTDGQVPPPPPPRAERGDEGAGETETGQPGELGLRSGVGVGDTTDLRAAEPPRGEGVVEADGLQSARVWEEEAEERRMRQREGDVSLRWRRARVTAEGARALAGARREVVRREEEGLRLAEELSEDRLLMALETLELAAEGQAKRRHILERKTRLTQDERLELKVLRRNAACLESLRRFEATAEAVDERGRRRLWVEYRREGVASEGRGRHHVIGGYRGEGGDDGEQSKWRSVSLQGCPREVRLLLAGPYYYNVDMVNSLPNVAGIEDRCLDCVRRVLQGEGWPARSWQQDGLLVEDMDGRQLRGGGGGGGPAVERLSAAMRKAEAAMLAQEGLEIGLLVKDFFEGPVEAVLQRMAGPGGRRPGVAEARGAARQARAAGGGRAPPPPRTLPAEARAATAESKATRAERTAAALAAEMEGLAQERRDTMLRRRQKRLDDALVAAADEPAVHETEAGGAGAASAAGAAGGRGGVAGARKRRRGEGEGEGEDGSEEGDDDEVAADLTTGGDDSVRATCDEARGDGGKAVTSGGDAGDDDGDDDGGDGDGGEARGGDAAMEGGEASGGSVATTGGGGDGGGEPAKPKRGSRSKGKGGNARRMLVAKGR